MAQCEGPGFTGISELALEVVDLAASERFYGEVLALPLVERWEDRGVAWFLVGDRTRLGLWRPQIGLAGGRGGLHVHFAMHLSEASYTSTVNRLALCGARLEEHLFADYDDSRAAYINDPDGNVVELWTFNVARQAPAASLTGSATSSDAERAG